MTKVSAFGEVLARLRKENGFATPYAFYKGRGGAKVLGMTFANYLNVERGKTLPKGEKLMRLFSALGVRLDSSHARGLLKAFVADTLGSDALLGALFAPERAQESASPDFRLAKQGLLSAWRNRRVQLSLEQLAVMARNPTAYACFYLIKGTPGMEIGELAKRARASVPAVKKALSEMVRAGLAKLSGALVSCPLTGKSTVLPDPTPATAAVLAALQRHRAAWVENHGRVLHAPCALIRTRAGGVERYFEHLTEAVQMAGLYHELAPADESENYLVEARVVKVFPSSRG